ncbi:MAG: hypothetical protein V3U29_01010 [Phycisphaeraceae bacterium]
MSVIGTGVAAGVANTSLQAQQVARDRDKERSETAKDARRVREMFETQLRALEEGEETPTQLRIDGHVPQHESPKETPNPPDTTAAQPAPEPPTAALPEAAPDPPLYRHLDIQA